VKMHVAVAKAVVQHCYPRWWPKITNSTITTIIRTNYILFSSLCDTTNNLITATSLIYNVT